MSMNVLTSSPPRTRKAPTYQPFIQEFLNELAIIAGGNGLMTGAGAVTMAYGIDDLPSWCWPWLLQTKCHAAAAAVPGEPARRCSTRLTVYLKGSLSFNWQIKIPGIVENNTVLNQSHSAFVVNTIYQHVKSISNIHLMSIWTLFLILITPFINTSILPVRRLIDLTNRI